MRKPTLSDKCDGPVVFVCVLLVTRPCLCQNVEYASVRGDAGAALVGNVSTGDQGYWTQSNMNVVGCADASGVAVALCRVLMPCWALVQRAMMQFDREARSQARAMIGFSAQKMGFCQLSHLLKAISDQPLPIPPPGQPSTLASAVYHGSLASTWRQITTSIPLIVGASFE